VATRNGRLLRADWICFPVESSATRPSLSSVEAYSGRGFQTVAERRCRMASKTRWTTARAMRKTHIPAYDPVLVGVQSMEYNGVATDWKKLMAISAEVIMVSLSMLAVEVADMAVAVAVAAMSMVEVDISILENNKGANRWRAQIIDCVGRMWTVDERGPIQEV
jgi:hypothetical protein